MSNDESVTEVYDEDEAYDAADHGLAGATVEDEAILYAEQLRVLKEAGF